MHIRKHRNKWQCIVRYKGNAVIQSFGAKSESRKWGEKTITDLRNGTYQNNDKLISMRLKDLLQLYYDKAALTSKRAKILKYEVDLIRRFPIARLSLAALSAVKIANFRDDRLAAGKSTTTVRHYLKLISRAITVGQRELGIPMQSNPVQMIEKPRAAPAKERTLSHEELQQLFDACNSCSKFHFLSAFADLKYFALTAFPSSN